MKKLIGLALIVLFSHNLFAQENTNSKNGDSYIYCEILGTQKLLSNKVSVNIDFGQNTRFGEDTRLRDESGKVVVFNSMVDAMNWMGGQGWELVQAYVFPSPGFFEYHWLIRYDLNKLTPEQLEQVTGKLKIKKNN